MTTLPKRIFLQHTFPIPGRPRAATRQTKHVKKKLPKPKPKGDGKRPPDTNAKDPETAREARRKYEQAKNNTPELREYHRRYAQEQRQKARDLGMCRNCRKPAILSQTRCPTCPEHYRQPCEKGNLQQTSAYLLRTGILNHGNTPSPSHRQHTIQNGDPPDKPRPRIHDHHANIKEKTRVSQTPPAISPKGATKRTPPIGA